LIFRSAWSSWGVVVGFVAGATGAAAAAVCSTDVFDFLGIFVVLFRS
jgi:hypothetical protein